MQLNVTNSDNLLYYSVTNKELKITIFKEIFVLISSLKKGVAPKI
jgi:hypothetical protein